MFQLSTDRQILEAIHNMYAKTFESAQVDQANDPNRIYLPIDVRKVAESIQNNPHVLFGRLYYHLDQKHRYKQNDGALVHLFAWKAGKDLHCVNFPYLAGVLSQMQEEDDRNKKTLRIAGIALILSVIGIGVQIFTA